MSHVQFRAFFRRPRGYRCGTATTASLWMNAQWCTIATTSSIRPRHLRPLGLPPPVPSTFNHPQRNFGERSDKLAIVGRSVACNPSTQTIHVSSSSPAPKAIRNNNNNPSPLLPINKPTARTAARTHHPSCPYRYIQRTPQQLGNCCQNSV